MIGECELCHVVRDLESVVLGLCSGCARIVELGARRTADDVDLRVSDAVPGHAIVVRDSAGDFFFGRFD